MEDKFQTAELHKGLLGCCAHEFAMAVASFGGCLWPRVSIESMSMVQTRLQLEPHPKPWEVYDYVTANYHKTGVYLMLKLHTAMFQIVGVGEDVMGKLEYPCYYGYPYPMCWNEEAPIILFTDGNKMPLGRPSSKLPPLLVVGSVRDPLEMVASAHYYHHEGKEMVNHLLPLLEFTFPGT